MLTVQECSRIGAPNSQSLPIHLSIPFPAHFTNNLILFLFPAPLFPFLNHLPYSSLILPNSLLFKCFSDSEMPFSLVEWPWTNEFSSSSDKLLVCFSFQIPSLMYLFSSPYSYVNRIASRLGQLWPAVAAVRTSATAGSWPVTGLTRTRANFICIHMISILLNLSSPPSRHSWRLGLSTPQPPPLWQQPGRGDGDR